MYDSPQSLLLWKLKHLVIQIYAAVKKGDKTTKMQERRRKEGEWVRRASCAHPAAIALLLAPSTAVASALIGAQRLLWDLNWMEPLTEELRVPCPNNCAPFII